MSRTPGVVLLRIAASAAAAVAILGTAAPAAAQVYPGASWQTATPEAMGMDSALLDQAEAYALTGGGAGMIIRSGYLVHSWGDTSLGWELKSSTKSIGSMLVGLAIGDGLFTLDDAMVEHLPSAGVPPSGNADSGWLPDITLRQLAYHCAGFGPEPGFQPLIEEPGTAWLYSDSGADWLADVLTTVFAQDLHVVLRNRVLNAIGVSTSALTWRNNWYRPTTLNGIPRREIGSGITASADAIARLAYLQLRGGVWNGAPLLHLPFTPTVREPDPVAASLPNLDPVRYPGGNSHIGLLWWTNASGAMSDVPTDAYFAWGLYDSVILVIPSLDVVAVRVGEGWRAGWNADYAYMEPFAGPIALSVQQPVDAPEEALSWGRLHGAFRSGATR